MFYKESIIEKLCSIIILKVCKYRVSLIASFIIGLLTYGFSLVHKLPNLDDIACLYNISHVGANHGRWMLNVVNLFMPDISMPWIFGILSLMIIAIANCYIIKIFNIDNCLLQVLISGLIISFPSLVGMMSYMFLSYSYSLAFLFSVMSVASFTNRGSSCCIRWIISSLLLFLSMGFYQAYLGVAVTLFLSLLMWESLNRSKTPNQLIRHGLEFLTFVIVVSIVYFVVNQLIFFLFDIHLVENAAYGYGNSMTIWRSIYWLLMNQVSALFFGTYGLVNTFLSRVLHVLIIILLLLAFVVFPLRNREYARVGINLLLLACLPFAINCIHLIAPTGTHSLTMTPFLCLYVITALIAIYYSQKGENILFDVVCLMFFLLCVNNIFIANKNHFKQFIQYENAKSFWTNVITRIEMTPGFNQSTKVALIGDASNCIYDFSDYNIDDITGIAEKTTVNLYSRKDFIKHINGFVIKYASDEDVEIIKHSPQYNQVPAYPYDGSVFLLNNCNIIVVKFE